MCSGEGAAGSGGMRASGMRAAWFADTVAEKHAQKALINDAEGGSMSVVVGGGCTGQNMTMSAAAVEQCVERRALEGGVAQHPGCGMFVAQAAIVAL